LYGKNSLIKKLKKEDCCMNYIKVTFFIVCSLMMNMALKGMENKLERSISNDRIFVWSNKDRDYHAVTEQGDISERILQKNDQAHKIYRTQLVIKEDGKHVLRTTQELIHYYTGDKFRNLMKYERLLIPISFSQEQGQRMWDAFQRFQYSEDKKEIILAMDNEDNVYFITHLYDGKGKNTKKGEFNHEQFRSRQIPLLKIAALEKEVEELQKQINLIYKKDNEVIVSNVEVLKNISDQRRRRVTYQTIGKIGIISFAALCAFLLYKHDRLVAFFNHQYQG
jgi:hypothetical protein